MLIIQIYIKKIWKSEVLNKSLMAASFILETPFFLKFLEDTCPFCGATDTPVLDFW